MTLVRPYTNNQNFDVEVYGRNKDISFTFEPSFQGSNPKPRTRSGKFWHEPFNPQKSQRSKLGINPTSAKEDVSELHSLWAQVYASSAFELFSAKYSKADAFYDQIDRLKRISSLDSANEIITRLMRLRSFAQEDGGDLNNASLRSFVTFMAFVSSSSWTKPMTALGLNGDITALWKGRNSEVLTIEFNNDETAKFIVVATRGRKPEDQVKMSGNQGHSTIKKTLCAISGGRGWFLK